MKDDRKLWSKDNRRLAALNMFQGAHNNELVPPCSTVATVCRRNMLITSPDTILRCAFTCDAPLYIHCDEILSQHALLRVVSASCNSNGKDYTCFCLWTNHSDICCVVPATYSEPRTTLAAHPEKC